MTTSGMLSEVQVLNRGSAATAAVDIGGTVVPVEDVTQFSNGGGSVQIDGNPYEYNSLDEDALTLTLASPLFADVSEFDPVLVMVGGQVVQDWQAIVDLGEGDTVSVPIPFALRTVLPEGQYDPPVPVDVADDLSTVLDVPGRTPVIDGTMIDPTTLPPSPAPTDPPASSPTLSVTPLNTALVVTATDVDQTTTINYYVSTVDGFTPDASTLVLSTRSTAVAIDQLADGTPLAQGVTYYIVAVASNVVGSAAPSPQVSGVLATSRVTVTADDVIGGTFTSAYDVTGSLTIGNITIDPDNGLEIPLASGGIIQFPADGSAATLQAHLDALSITVQDNLTINGVHNDVAGTVALDNVPVAPTVAPQLSLITLTQGDGYQLSGTLPNVSGGSFLWPGTLINTASAFYVVADAGGKLPICAIDKTTGAVTTVLADLSTKLPASAYQFDSLAYNETTGNWYVLYQRSGSSGPNYVRVFDSSWVLQADYAAGGLFDNGGANVITYDASTGNVVILGWHLADVGANYPVVILRDAATGAFVAQDTSAITDSWGLPKFYGLVTGPCDFGANRMVTVTSTGRATVHPPAGTAGGLDGSYPAYTFRDTTATVNGCCWDGFNFWYLVDSASGTYDLRKLSPVVTAQSRSVTWTQYCDATRAGSTGPYETKPSPAATVSQAPRSWLRVTVPAPNDGGGPNDPNASRVYIANHLQGALTGGGTAMYGAPTTTGQAAPTTEGFVSATGGSLGKLVSQAVDPSGASLISLKGDGTVVLSRFSQSGLVTITPTTSVTGGFTGSAQVTFRAPFPSNPQITVSVNGTNPNNFSASFSNVSSTGFTVYLFKNASTSTTVHWIASLA